MHKSVVKALFVACLAFTPALLAQNWFPQTPGGSPPPALDGSAMVYDPIHHQSILFGGADNSGTVYNRTYAYDGTSWTLVNDGSSNAPPARLWHSMAFDAASQSVILFGGCADVNCVTYMQDTWSWNGSAWSNLTASVINSSNTPGKRRGAAMTYIAGYEGYVLLFGGSYSGTAFADTWLWTGNQWAEQDTSPVPAREFASLSYDPIAQNAVMFGGQSGGSLEQDTWLWDGSDWSGAEPEEFPSARSGQGQVYDPVRQTTVLFGGNYQNDTWLWDRDSQNWAAETTATLPTGRDCPGFAYDIQHAKLVMYGGQSYTAPTTYTDLSDTWTLGFQYTPGWMPVNPSISGLPAARANMASGSDGTNTYMFGGIDSNNTINSDFWTWTGSLYSIAQPSGGPSAREYAALAYSPDDSGMLLFGGGSGAGGATPVTDTTWIYSGGTWEQVTGGLTPGPLIGPSMVYDSVDDEQVLFGGYNNGLTPLTWTFFNDGWHIADVPSGPPGRWLASMVYDAARSEVLLFGGQGATSSVIMNDTWVFNGSGWSNIIPAHMPAQRYNASMVYDSVHGRVILIGGEGANGPLNDEWQWDGVDWSPLSVGTSSNPPARSGASAAYDSGTEQFVVFGGYGGSSGQTVLADTWLYASPYVNSTTLPVGFYQENYSAPISPLGGVSNYSFGDIGTPFGNTSLSLNFSTGVVAGTDNLTPELVPLEIPVTVADSQGQSTVIPIALFTDNPIVFNPTPPSVATSGTTYSYPLSSSASGGTAPFSYSITSGPAWLSIVSGTLTGSCPASTSNQVSLQVLDSLGATASAGPFTVDCNPAPQITNTSPLAGGQVGVGYSVQLGTNADYSAPGASPYTWSITAGALPQGLGIGSTTGAITGNPTATGTATFTVTFIDAWGASTSHQFQITILPQLLITTTQMALGNLNIPYPANQAFAATGGAGGFTFSAGNLPPGLQLNSATGAITGTPTTLGNYNVMVTVTDQASNQYENSIQMYVVNAGSDPVDWVQLNPTTMPGGRYQPVMFYYPDTSTTILFGGANAAGSLGDTWSWDGTNWTPLLNAGTPGTLVAAAAAYDPVHHQAVLFGGLSFVTGNEGALSNQTWIWNGSTWSQPPNVNSGNSPSARSDAVMFWDGQQIVLFGGFNGGNSLNETWVWNGTGWSQPPNVNPGNSPPARGDATAVYDVGHNQAVLFGGWDLFSSNTFSDTWIWNGTAWSQPPNVSYVNSPSLRAYAGMTYDSIHSQTVLYGGYNYNGGESDEYSDTWTWNGTAWTQLFPPYGPSNRNSFGMAYDAAHGQSVLFGGENNGSSLYNDTWLFTGPVASTALPAGYVSTPYNDTISVQGGIPSDTYVLSGSLPPGMSFNANTQTFGGTPTQLGNFTIPITVQDSQGIAIVPGYTVTISPPLTPLQISPTTLPDATADTPYSVQLSASGGAAPYTFSAQNLPNGLSLNANNQIVGQCSSGSTTVMLQVTDSIAEMSSAGPLTVNCNPGPSLLTTSPLPNGVAGVAYSTTLQVTGGTPAIAWTLGANNLPNGFGLSTAGVLTGTSSVATTYSLSVTATDRWGANIGGTFTVTFNPPLSLTNSTLPNATAGTNYMVQLGASGGLPPYTFSAQNLPAGLSLNVNSQIVGLCTASSATVALKVTDSIGDMSGFTGLTVTCNAAPSITTTSLPVGVMGVPYSTTLQMTGGTPTINWALGANNLPNGFGLSTAGVLTGTSSTATTYSLTVSVTDIWGATASKNFNLTFNNTLTLTTTSLPNATAGTNYSVQLAAGGGVQPYTFTTQNLPAGLSLNGNNQIVGLCTGSSTTVGIKVTDSLSDISSVTNLTVTCNAAPSITTTSPLTSGVAGVAYTDTLQMTGGTPTINWALGATNLPNGFQLSTAGILTGTAPSANTYSLTVSATDIWGASASQNFTLTFYPVLSITTASLPSGMAGTAYQNGVSLGATGGTGAGTYQFTATGLPTGFLIDLNSGAISGATTQTGTFTPTFKVTDQDAQVASKQINLVIQNGAGITFGSPTVLPTAATGQLYTYQLMWSGGVPTTTIASSALPAWLSLNASTGLLSGTPTAGGAYTFPVTVTDSQIPTPNTASQNETIVVNPPSITSVSPLSPATIGIAYSQNLTASGGAGGYSWTSSNLPAWLSLANGGALTGTPPVNTPANVTFNVTVTDSLGAYTSGSLTLPVLATPALFFETASPLPPATPNVAYSTPLQGGGGNSAYSFNASGAPKWLSLISSGPSSFLSGTPSAAGPVTFQITLSDNVNQSLTEYFTIPVNSTLVFGTASTLPPATVQQPYSQTLAASGGSGSYTWSATGLPAWLALSAQGVLSGTPPQAASVSFRVTVKDTNNHSLSQTFNLQAMSALTINTAATLAPATLNFPYYTTFAASGGGNNYQWSATGLPSGFTLSNAGVLLGTAQTANSIAFTAQVTDSENNSATLNVTLPVNANITINTASPLATATQSLPYSANLTASGGVPGYTWTASGLPAWLSLSQAGYLSGTPTAAGSVTFQATVTDSQNNTVNAQITVPVSPSLSVTTASPLTAIVNSPYSATLTATGGVGPYTWSAQSLPKGLTLSPNGQLNGSFAQTNSYTLQVTVYDTETSITTASLTLLVSTGFPLSFVTQSLNPCIANTYCTNQIVATGGIPPYTFSLAPNANIGGLTLSGNGVLSGTPTAAGGINIPVIVTDQQSSASHTYVLGVISNISITNTTMPNGTVGQAYGVELAATGGSGSSYTWSLAGGTLPPGLNFDTFAGEVYGTPSQTGVYAFSVTATDGQQTSPARQLTITIQAPPVPLTITTAMQLPAGSIGTPYAQSLSANGGSGSYTWSLTGGALPAGLSLANTGAITGTPTGAQNASFTAAVKDTYGNSAASGFTLIVVDPTVASLVTPNPLPNGAVNVPYQYVIQVLGGSPPYTYSIVAGQLPPGIMFDSLTGTLIGTPSVKGTFGLVLSVTDSGNAGANPAGKTQPHLTTTSTYNIQIAGPGDFQVTTQTLPLGTLGVNYSATLAASGGKSPYQWQLLNGTLPKGLTLTTAGVLTGIPAVSGTSQLVIQATDSNGAIASVALLLQIANPNAPAIEALPPLPAGTTGVAYQGGLTAIGGHTPYTWSISGGSLPAGLSLNPQTGALSGMPAQAGQFPFVAQVTDTNKVSGTQSFTILVNSPTLSILPATIPPGTVNVPYTFGLSVSGGTGPYTWSLSAGGLLQGFNLNPTTGVISGTPTVAGAYQFTISVADSAYGLSSQTYTYTVQTNGITLLPPSAPAATVGVAYSLGFSAQNSAAPLTFAVTSGSLPPGLQLAAGSSALTGTPTKAGTYAFTITVTDATSATASIAYTLVVNAAKLSIVTASLPSGAAGTAYSQTLQSSGGNGTISWSIASGSLPTGLALSAAGAIAGTPAAAGSFSFTVAATDSTGVSVQEPLSLTIGAPPAAPAITLTGLPATSIPGAQPTVTINLASAYPLPIQVTATLSISPGTGNTSDLMFQNGSRTTQITIAAGATTAALPFQVGTLAGTIQLTLALNAAGVNITPAAPPAAATTIAAGVPVISKVSVAATATGLQVTVVGTSTTLNMTNATFTFTPAAGSTLQTSTFTVNVSALFSAWYASAASFPTGSQFSLIVPFTTSGNVSSIASVSVTLTNSAGTSAAVSANVP